MMPSSNVPAYTMGSPQQQYAQPMVPPSNQPIASGSPTHPNLQPIPVGTSPVNKIKLTTKDGKPIDLEEKKKSLPGNGGNGSGGASGGSTGSPQPQPHAASASPSSQASSITSAPSKAPVKPAVSAAAGNSAAEEFKRKIREKAEATKLAKEKAERDAKEAKEKEAREQAEKEAKEKAEQEAKERAEQEAKEAERKAKEQAENEAKLKAEQEAKAVAEEQAKSKQTQEPAGDADQGDHVKFSEPVAENKPAEAEGETEGEGQPQGEAQAEAETEGEAQAPEQAEQQPEFTISKFLERVSTATPIADPFTTVYPESINGVDSSKKLEGKVYRYDPGFLYQFKEYTQFAMDPEFKAHLDKVHMNCDTSKKPQGRMGSKFGNGPQARFGGQIQRGQQFNDPKQNSRSGSKRRGGGSSSSREKSRGKNHSRRGRDYKEKSEEEQMNAQITIPKDEIKPLEKSENRWVPRSRAKKEETNLAPDGSEILGEEDVNRKVKSLLNKLTLEMFQPITDSVLKIADQSKWEKDSKTIRQIIQLTFAKACDEPYWSEMYAKFCAKMCTSIPAEVVDETMTLKDGSHPSGGALARRLLLTTCQTEYEKGWSDKLPTNEDGSPLEPEMMSDEYYAMAAAKRRGLGLVKFIGHLYNLNMLNDQVIFVCLKDQCKNVVDPSEDSLENLVQLVKTVGPKLDGDERTKTILKIVFDNIQKILDNVKLSSRIMFMLMDLQDLRKARWSSAKSDAGPKTIEEIHRDAEIKRMEEAKASNEKKQQRRNEGRSNSSRSGSSWNNNNTSHSNSANNSPFLNNLKKSPSFATVNQRSSSNISSSGSVGSDMQRETSKRSESTHINRFAALGGDDDEEGDDQRNDNEAEVEGEALGEPTSTEEVSADAET